MKKVNVAKNIFIIGIIIIDSKVTARSDSCNNKNYMKVFSYVHLFG